MTMQGARGQDVGAAGDEGRSLPQLFVQRYTEAFGARSQDSSQRSANRHAGQASFRRRLPGPRLATEAANASARPGRFVKVDSSADHQASPMMMTKCTTVSGQETLESPRQPCDGAGRAQLRTAKRPAWRRFVFPRGAEGALSTARGGSHGINGRKDRGSDRGTNGLRGPARSRCSFERVAQEGLLTCGRKPTKPKARPLWRIGLHRRQARGASFVQEDLSRFEDCARSFRSTGPRPDRRPSWTAAGRIPTTDTTVIQTRRVMGQEYSRSTPVAPVYLMQAAIKSCGEGVQAHREHLVHVGEGWAAFIAATADSKGRSTS